MPAKCAVHVIGAPVPAAGADSRKSPSGRAQARARALHCAKVHENFSFKDSMQSQSPSEVIGEIRYIVLPHLVTTKVAWQHCIWSHHHGRERLHSNVIGRGRHGCELARVGLRRGLLRARARRRHLGRVESAEGDQGIGSLADEWTGKKHRLLNGSYKVNMLACQGKQRSNQIKNVISSNVKFPWSPCKVSYKDEMSLVKNYYSSIRTFRRTSCWRGATSGCASGS